MPTPSPEPTAKASTITKVVCPHFGALYDTRNPLTSTFASPTPLMCPSTAELGVQIDAEFLQASLTLMAIQCELLDTIAAIDPTDAEAVADRILAAIPEAVAALEANGVTPDQAAVLEAMPGWYAAMFTAAADCLCPQHAEALDNAVANAARAQP
jgi:hypothetical protein